jgi:hypothetical protein
MAAQLADEFAGFDIPEPHEVVITGNRCQLSCRIQSHSRDDGRALVLRGGRHKHALRRDFIRRQAAG